jgi:hypothetical protein
MTSTDDYGRIVDTRMRRPGAFQAALRDRERRSELAPDGHLFIVAADHPARGSLRVGDRPLAMADRAELLARLRRALANPRVDGVLGSADVLEELAFLGLLEGKVAVGTMNRGGLAGSVWELDDRFTAYDPRHVVERGLDAGKLLLRIDDQDPGSLPTLESAARVVTELADAGIPVMVEPLPYTTDEAGRAVLLRDDAALARVSAVAAGLGSSSAYTWLKIPAGLAPERVLPTTTLPTLLLGGDPGADPSATYAGWERALAHPAARGLVVGRALLYPSDDDVEGAVEIAARLVNDAAARTDLGQEVRS